MLLQSQEKLEDYDELLGELRALDRVLQNIKRLYGSTAVISSSDKNTFELIEQEIAACEHAMAHFLEKNGPPTTWWKKVHWMFLASSRAATLRRKLAIHRQNLNLLLIQYNSTQIRSFTPRMQTVSFIDAVGNPIPIPFILCRTYKVPLHLLFRKLTT